MYFELGSCDAITVPASVMAVPRPGKNCRVIWRLNQRFHIEKPTTWCFQMSATASENGESFIWTERQWFFVCFFGFCFFKRPVEPAGRVLIVARATQKNPLHGGSGAPGAPYALRRTGVCACCSHVSSLASVPASTTAKESGSIP